jgi:hypothetical protein
MTRASSQPLPRNSVRTRASRWAAPTTSAFGYGGWGSVRAIAKTAHATTKTTAPMTGRPRTSARSLPAAPVGHPRRTFSLQIGYFEVASGWPGSRPGAALGAEAKDAGHPRPGVEFKDAGIGTVLGTAQSRGRRNRHPDAALGAEAKDAGLGQCYARPNPRTQASAPRVGDGGLEPPTSSLSERRSNRLS